MALAVSFQICVPVEGTEAAVMVTPVSSFMSKTDMGAKVKTSVCPLQPVWDGKLTSIRMDDWRCNHSSHTDEACFGCDPWNQLQFGSWKVPPILGWVMPR